MKIKIFKTVLLVMVSAILMVANAMAGSYGKLVPDRDLAKTFETYTILDTHNYYIFGPDDLPHVIIAVDKEFNIVKKFWKTVQPDAEQLKDWIDFMEMQSDSNPGLAGAKIIDGNDNQIGIWYSRWNRTTIKTEENNEINIYTPNPKQLIKKSIHRGGNRYR